MLCLTKVLADNTNRDRDARAHWVKVAHEYKVPIRCILFTASARLAEHNDMVRSLNSNVSLLSQSEHGALVDLRLTTFHR